MSAGKVSITLWRSSESRAMTKEQRVRKSSADPCLFVIIGARGDLTRRKLLPALYQLMDDAQLPDRCHILGVGRDEKLTDERFRAQACAELAKAASTSAQKTRRWCDARIDYQGIGEGAAADYERLAVRIADIERRRGLPGNRVLYLALPPAAFPGTIEALGKAGLNRSKGWTRLVIEKPFGHDLASAPGLNALVHRYFDEAQVYRIDHYLGKETVQNLLAFRFGNALFESAWNRDHIESVRITVAEALGIEQRARLLRADRRAARHGAEPPHAAAHPDRDGGRRRPSKPTASASRK